jgi:hypothetical protein
MAKVNYKNKYNTVIIYVNVIFHMERFWTTPGVFGAVFGIDLAAPCVDAAGD